MRRAKFWFRILLVVKSTEKGYRPAGSMSMLLKKWFPISPVAEGLKSSRVAFFFPSCPYKRCITPRRIGRTPFYLRLGIARPMGESLLSHRETSCVDTRLVLYHMHIGRISSQIHKIREVRKLYARPTWRDKVRLAPFPPVQSRQTVSHFVYIVSMFRCGNLGRVVFQGQGRVCRPWGSLSQERR